MVQAVEALVNRTLRDLEIAHVADSIVGSVLVKGVSGGQLKRVNIGMGVMAMPSVRFCAEQLRCRPGVLSSFLVLFCVWRVVCGISSG